MAVEELRKSAMMSHLLDAMDKGEDIGHYGRLVFTMVGQHFLSEEEMLEHLTKDKDCDEDKARAIIRQVTSHGYNPPKPVRIFEWMDQQQFPICNDSEGAEACNVYKSLKFPQEVYDKISSYYQNDSGRHSA